MIPDHRGMQYDKRRYRKKVKSIKYKVRMEAQYIQENRFVIWDERPIKTAFHRSVRGVSFHSQGWVDLRQLWFG